jgi:hypothetical protein
MRMRNLIGLALVLALGCDSSDKSKKGDAGADGVDQVAVTPACPAGLVGTWKMISVFCGDIDVTASIGSQGGISEMRLQVSDSGTDCVLVATASGPTCTETEDVSLVPDGAGNYAVVGKGITECQPAQCVFNANDAPCALGDRASSASVSATALKSDGAALTLSSQPPSGLCGGYGQATITTYTKL